MLARFFTLERKLAANLFDRGFGLTMHVVVVVVEMHDKRGRIADAVIDDRGNDADLPSASTTRALVVSWLCMHKETAVCAAPTGKANRSPS